MMVVLPSKGLLFDTDRVTIDKNHLIFCKGAFLRPHAALRPAEPRYCRLVSIFFFFLLIRRERGRKRKPSFVVRRHVKSHEVWHTPRGKKEKSFSSLSCARAPLSNRAEYPRDFDGLNRERARGKFGNRVGPRGMRG